MLQEPLDMLLMEFAIREAAQEAARKRKTDPNEVQDAEEYERRWCAVPEYIRLLARRDALLNALLHLHARRRRDRPLSWCAQEYLRIRRPECNDMLDKMERSDSLLLRLFPEWKESASPIVDSPDDLAQARSSLETAGYLYGVIMRQYMGWLEVHCSPMIEILKPA